MSEKRPYEPCQDHSTPANEQVGYLINGQRFECLECAMDCRIPVFRINIGIYSQQCAKCKRLVVDGLKKSIGSSVPLNLFIDGLEELDGSYPFHGEHKYDFFAF